MSLDYRSEIDGLRAVAVIAVIIYHLEIIFGTTQLLKGGFLGVDIFFVISGFLITAIIYKQHKTAEGFSYRNFYEKRCRRLLPVLSVVILSCVPIAYFLMLPAQFIDFGASIYSTLFFGANFYWFASLGEYGTESSLLKPFLHSWSLAVEEQYYIFFPCILLALYRWFKNPIIILCGACVLFLGVSSYLTQAYPYFSFYMLPSRLWELLAGGVLALYMYIDSGNYLIQNRWSKFLPFLGSVLIGSSFFLINFSDNHPGLMTVPTILGTLLIICYADKNEWVTRVLSLNFLRYAGLISYSLYLWHYPIFAFGRILDPSPTWHDKVQWCLITVILSSITYYLIEKPFRNIKLISTQVFYKSIIAVYIFIGGFLAVMVYNKAALVVDIDFDKEMSHRTSWHAYGYNVCIQKEVAGCHDFTGIEKKTVLVIGDSMAPDALRIFARMRPDYNYILSSAGYCIPTLTELKREKDNLPECNSLNKVRFSPDSLQGVDSVLIITIGYDEKVFLGNEEIDIEGYLHFLKANNILEISIVGTYLTHYPRIYDLYLRTGGNQEKIERSLTYANTSDDADEKLIALAKNYNAQFISVRDTVCKEGECMVFLPDGTPYSWDNHHWTNEFTNYISDKLYSLNEKYFVSP